MVLICSITESGMEWLYNGVMILRSAFSESLDPVGASRSLQASGFMFSAEVISIRPPVFATTLSFSADTAMNGDSVSCRASPSHQLSQHTIQVRSECMHVVFNNIIRSARLPCMTLYHSNIANNGNVPKREVILINARGVK